MMTASKTIAEASRTFNVGKIRQDFPVLHREVYGNQLVYLDNGASSQKPKQVIDTISDYYFNRHSNVHRGVHHLSAEATSQYEAVRTKTRDYINASKEAEVIFTKGTTEGINLAANSFGKKYLNEGDEVVISAMEHHSNIVPWQMICDDRKAKLKVIPITDEGEIIFEEFEKLLTDKTKIVAVCHVSNTLGTVNPVKDIIKTAHNRNIPVLLDGAQAAPHIKIDVQELDVDFYLFSSHKMFGPTGVGVLYGKEKWLSEMPPYQGGGEMIECVTFEKTTYNKLPFKFEAGTPNISGVIGFGAAIDYMNKIGHENIAAYEEELLKYATERLLSVEGLRIIGTAKDKVPVVSFLVGNIHPYDTGAILDRMGIAVRTGHHCTEPLMNRLGITGTVRASFAFYNTKGEVDALIKGLEKVKTMFE